MFTITWSENERRTAATVEQVDRVLDELDVRYRERDPQLVTVEVGASRASLAIGVGRERSVLNFVAGSKDPPYFTSIGHVDVDEPITFRFNGALSEFPMRNSVPYKVAREAMRYFCATGELSSAISWEED